MKHAPANVRGTNNRMTSMIINSMLIRTMPIDMPAFSGIA